MGRESESTILKKAWIDEDRRIISFTSTEHARDYLAEEQAFWQQIAALMHSGYRIQ